jgi:uncharacterized oligopeptide transporter (OPT) family protein
MGMLIPAGAVLTMLSGAVFALLWSRVSPRSHARRATPLASGFIAGEALVAILLPVLVALGLLRLQP